MYVCTKLYFSAKENLETETLVRQLTIVTGEDTRLTSAKSVKSSKIAQIGGLSFEQDITDIPQSTSIEETVTSLGIQEIEELQAEVVHQERVITRVKSKAFRKLEKEKEIQRQ